MPNIKSAKKRVKVMETKNMQNRMVMSSLRTSIKKFEAAVAAGEADSAKALYKSASSALDKAVIKGTIHKNTANRQKSRLAKDIARIAE